MFFSLFILISITLVVFWLLNRWLLRNYIHLAYQIPNNRWHRFLGFGKILNIKNLLKYVNDYSKKYGSNSVLWIAQIPVFLTSDPVAIKEIFLSKNCVNKPEQITMGVTKTAGGLGPITANEPIWSSHRKVLIKVFTTKNLISFITIFNQGVNNLIKEIDISLENGNNIDMLKVLRQMILKNSSKTMLKRNLDQTKFDTSTMVDFTNKILDYAISGCADVYWIISYIHKLLDKSKFKDVHQGVAMYKNLISESWNIVKTNNMKGDNSFVPELNTTLDYVLKGVQADMMQEHEVSSEVLQLFLAGFETSSATLYFVLMLLAMHPEYQERVYEEIQNILSDNKNDNNNDLTLEHVNQMTYLEMVINETMRVIPIVPFVIRKVSNENLTLSTGGTLAVGQPIAIDIFSLHRSKKVWGPNAESFNPDNFLPSNVASRHPYSFIPFTKGQRFCTGWRYGMLVSKVTLAKLLGTYTFSTDFKYENLKFYNSLTIKLLEEPQLYLKKR